ncbi:MAG TPA: hypothetical protein VKQ71_05195, partial [Acidimicrobiales bacterium]|nr:hypothetical protein [Acidimicrobiales bacterium]
MLVRTGTSHQHRSAAGANSTLAKRTGQFMTDRRAQDAAAGCGHHHGAGLDEDGVEAIIDSRHERPQLIEYSSRHQADTQTSGPRFIDRRQDGITHAAILSHGAV